MIYILYKMGVIVLVVIHIYVDRAIFVLFYYDQDTLSTYCEIQIGISQLIYTHKIYQRLYATMISIRNKMEDKYCGNS